VFIHCILYDEVILIDICYIIIFNWLNNSYYTVMQRERNYKLGQEYRKFSVSVAFVAMNNVMSI